MLFTPYKAVILSEAPRGSIAQRTAYGAQSKDPGDACWQMLFRAFQPQTTGQIKKVTRSDRSVSRFPTSPYSPLPRMRLSLEKGAQSLSTPPSSTGNLGERSGGICSSADL